MDHYSEGVAVYPAKLLTRYNYYSFVPELMRPWLNFENGAPIGKQAPDGPLWYVDETETWLSDICQQHRIAVVDS